MTDALGNVFDLVPVENTNDVKRRYSGLTTQAQLSRQRRSTSAATTRSRALWGNVEGETAQRGPSVAQVNAYPEYKRREWNYPDGDLAIDQRHRARVWGTYVVPMPSTPASLTFGLVQQFGSGVPYGARDRASAQSRRPLWSNPGYLTPQAPPQCVDYFFTARDAFRTETTYRTDLSVNYALPASRGGAQPDCSSTAKC